MPPNGMPLNGTACKWRHGWAAMDRCLSPWMEAWCQYPRPPMPYNYMPPCPLLGSGWVWAVQCIAAQWHATEWDGREVVAWMGRSWVNDQDIWWHVKLLTMAANAIMFDMQSHAAKYNGAWRHWHVTAAWCSLVLHGTGAAADRAWSMPHHWHIPCHPIT